MNKCALLLLALSILSACSDTDQANKNGDIIAAVGKTALTRSDLRKALPGGLSADDSTAFARAYIRRWIDSRLIERVATDAVDIAEIDRLTAEYRQNLIMSQYRRAMATQADGFFSEDTLLAYYDSHKSEFRLERPLVRGVYLKVPDDASNLRLLKRLYTSVKAADMDRLEKEAPKTALHYDYFRERWIDWEQIEKRIPADIPSPDAFLRAGRPLDVSQDGFTYLLHVSEYLPTGSTLPFEAAEPIIRERLLTRNRMTYDARLLKDLYDRAVDNGTLTFPAGSPF